MTKINFVIVEKDQSDDEWAMAIKIKVILSQEKLNYNLFRCFIRFFCIKRIRFFCKSANWKSGESVNKFFCSVLKG